MRRRLTLALALAVAACAAPLMKRRSGVYSAEFQARTVRLELFENGAMRLKTLALGKTVAVEEGRWSAAPDGAVNLLIEVRDGLASPGPALGFRHQRGVLILRDPGKTRYGEFGLTLKKAR